MLSTTKPQILADVVALRLIPKTYTTAEVIAASPITHQPGTRPYRIVIMNWGTDGGEDRTLSVHTEIFRIDRADGHVEDLAVACEEAPSYCESGDYFGIAELPQAMAKFCERTLRSATHAASIYRNRR